jgi:hypothetical protein
MPLKSGGGWAGKDILPGPDSLINKFPNDRNRHGFCQAIRMVRRACAKHFPGAPQNAGQTLQQIFPSPDLILDKSFAGYQ